MSSFKPKAIGLLSGGLDSTLALMLMLRQGVEVQGLHFHTGFCFTDVRRTIQRRDGDNQRGGPSDALSVAARLKVPIEVVDISNGYLQVLHHPRYGYGKNVNPCVDCRIYMFRIARQKMEEYGAQFVFTGEVLGQRPKSQHLEQLKIIAQQSNLEDRLLRPLSALLLPPTLPEREGWVDRSQLMGFYGRTRKPQMALAAELGLQDYPQPAGGCCFLTDPAFARKVRDLWEHSSKDELEWEDYLLLKVGRHIRIGPHTKLIVGRDEGENSYLDQMRRERWRLEVEGFKGPVALIDGVVNEDLLLQAARIVARYSDGREAGVPLRVRVETPTDQRFVEVETFPAELIRPLIIT